LQLSRKSTHLSQCLLRAPSEIFCGTPTAFHSALNISYAGRHSAVQPFTSLSNQENPYGYVNDAIDEWSEHHDSSPLQKGIQAAWDDLACRDSLNSLLNTNGPWNHCRLLAAQENHTADWSEAFSIAIVGNLLSPDELRIAIALRTGAKIFESTKCRCGKIIGEPGLHGLSCTKNAASQDIQPSTPSSRGH